MTESSSNRASTPVSRILKANRKAVYDAFLNPNSVASWPCPKQYERLSPCLRRARGWHILNVAHLPGPEAFVGRKNFRRHGHSPRGGCKESLQKLAALAE